MAMVLLLSFLLVCQTAQIRLNQKLLSVELAITEKEHHKGLMGRVELSDYEGMLFVYDKPRILNFWMKETKIPLSIGFFDENQRLFDVQEMTTPKKNERFPKMYISSRPALYALEVPAGWFERHGIEPGVCFYWLKEN